MEEVRHKHYEYIIAWAKGHKIQVLLGNQWVDADEPVWKEDLEYRIKPEYATKEFRFEWSFGCIICNETQPGNGNVLVTFDKINGKIVDISMLI